MCGRYTLHTDADLLRRIFELVEVPRLRPRYNIAPSQPAPVVRQDREGRRHLAPLLWGLVPFWAKDPKIGHRLINARAETVAAKPAYRAAFRARRCLVPAEGFYEWAATGGPRKQPYWIHRPGGEPFAMAGLWEVWQGDGESYLETFTIITTEATADLRPIHDRMPLVISPADWAAWLDPNNRDRRRLDDILRRPDEIAWRARPVSTAVNDPRHEGPDLIRPRAEP